MPVNSESVDLVILYYFYILGTFHQYDTIAYPRKTQAKKVFPVRLKEEVAQKGWFWGAIGAVRGVFAGGKQSSAEEVKEEEFKPFNLKDMCSACLPAYLQDQHALLSKCIFPEKFSIPEIVEEMHYLYSSLHHPLAIHDNRTVPLPRPQEDIPQVCQIYSDLADTVYHIDCVLFFV